MVRVEPLPRTRPVRCWGRGQGGGPLPRIPPPPGAGACKRSRKRNGTLNVLQHKLLAFKQAVVGFFPH